MVDHSKLGVLKFPVEEKVIGDMVGDSPVDLSKSIENIILELIDL